MCDLCWYHVYDFIVTIIIIMTTTTTTTTISSSHVMAPDQRVQMLMKGLAQMDGGGEGEGEDINRRGGDSDPLRRAREESRGRGGWGGERPPPAQMGGIAQHHACSHFLSCHLR